MIGFIFCVHFWFIVFVAFVMDCYTYCCCFIIRRKLIFIWHWKKNAFGFCTVIVLFTLGAYLIQLFNKVYDFIWSISTHGINICVVWSCIFLSVQINVIVSISFSRCLNKMCFLQIQSVQVCGIKRVIIQTTNFLQIKAYTVKEN